MANDIESDLKDKIYEWVSETCFDSEDEVSSAIASTNSIFMEQYCDEVELDELDELDEETYEFVCKITLNGEPRKDDVPFCGDTIHVTVTGTIEYDADEDDWFINDEYQVGASVEDWWDDEGLDDRGDEPNVYDGHLIPQDTYVDADKLISALSELPAKSWFRGHSDQDWELKPSIARQEKPSLSLEKQLRLEFENQTTFLSPNLHPLGKAKCNFLMQHHGLPTRLLDWTTSPLVALYFAVSNPKHDDVDACIWVLDPSQLNRTYREEFPFELHGENENIFTEESSRLLAIHAPYTDLRMKMQRSEFTVHTHYGAIEKDIGATVFLRRKIIINKNIKSELRDKLHVFGIDLSFLFPDMDNIAKSVANNLLE